MSKLDEYRKLAELMSSDLSIIEYGDNIQLIKQWYGWMRWKFLSGAILDLLNRLKIAEDALKTYAVAEGQMIVDEKTREPIDSNIAKAALEVINE